VAIGVGALYATPLFLLTGSPLSNVSGYKGDWHHGFPLSVPIYPLIKDGLTSHQPLTNTIKIVAYILAVLFVLVYYGIIKGQIRAFFLRYPEETLASVMVILFQLSYNSKWAWAEFPRYIVPGIPFLLAQAGVERIRPRWLLVAAPVFGLLGGLEIVRLNTLLHSLHH
jgi:uncharacterized membrane protein YsdA (DUF1294 family)